MAAQVALPRTAAAYSSFPDYVRPIQEGGGGGRLFTGTPADGYGCDVCHRGAQGAPLEVLGLPDGGYVPGQTYEILLRWPEAVPHVAVMAEITDAAGAPAGITALAPYATWLEGERCAESGFPAADVCRGSGCCRDEDPTRDACSFPGERTVLWVIDCGSRHARMVWTAPSVPVGDVWFSAEMVTSDLQNDARGDGVSSVRRRIHPANAPAEVLLTTSQCRAAAPGLSAGPPARGGPWLLALLALLLRRARTKNTSPTGHDRYGRADAEPEARAPVPRSRR